MISTKIGLESQEGLKRRVRRLNKGDQRRHNLESQEGLKHRYPVLVSAYVYELESQEGLKLRPLSQLNDEIVTLF